MELSRSEMSELNDICWHWETAYVIGYEDGMYFAARIADDEHKLTADTTAALREAIRQDYFRWTASLRERSST